MELYQSPRKFTHERTVYSLLDTIGDIGGFADAIKYMLTFIMSFYSPALLNRSLVKTFQVEKK